MAANARHVRILELLILHGPLTFEALQEKARMRRSDDAFGLLMGELAERQGKRDSNKPVEWWPNGATRIYQVKPEVLARGKR